VCPGDERCPSRSTLNVVPGLAPSPTPRTEMGHSPSRVNGGALQPADRIEPVHVPRRYIQYTLPPSPLHIVTPGPHMIEAKQLTSSFFSH